MRLPLCTLHPPLWQSRRECVRSSLSRRERLSLSRQRPMALADDARVTHGLEKSSFGLALVSRRQHQPKKRGSKRGPRCCASGLSPNQQSRSRRSRGLGRSAPSSAQPQAPHPASRLPALDRSEDDGVCLRHWSGGGVGAPTKSGRLLRRAWPPGAVVIEIARRMDIRPGLAPVAEKRQWFRSGRDRAGWG